MLCPDDTRAQQTWLIIIEVMLNIQTITLVRKVVQTTDSDQKTTQSILVKSYGKNKKINK